MNENYQLGPVAISKSFVNRPLFWPGVLGFFLVVIGLAAIKTGKLSLPEQTPTPSVMAQVFPLNQRFSKPLIYSAGTTIYSTDGQSEEKLFEVGSEVLSLVISNDGSKLAATYKLPSGGTNASGYPYSSLIFYDMNTRRSLPLIAQEKTTARYPNWSDDSRYISFWVNDGEESFIYDTNRKKAIFSVKKEGSSAVSPIVFLPGSTGIVYVKNNTIYSAAIDGSRPISLVEQAAATESTNGTATVASPPLVSPNGSYLAYYTLGGELAVVNTSTRETKTVGEGLYSLGFINNDELLYNTAEASSSRTPTISRFSITDGKKTALQNRQSFLARGAWPETAVLQPMKDQFYLASVYPKVGPQLLTKGGTIKQDCSDSSFSYEYSTSHNSAHFSKAIDVLSTDGSYLAGSSNGSLAVLDTSDCQPYIISEVRPSATTWMP